MNTLTEIHHFVTFSISRSVSGDYYAETDQGETLLLLSPSGSDEHAEVASWIESDERQSFDFADMIEQARADIETDETEE